MSEYIGLVSSVVGFITLIGTGVLWYYKKNPSIKVSIQKSNNSISILVRNHKDAHVKVKHVLLATKSRFKNGLHFDHHSFFSLVDNDQYGFQSTQNNNLDMTLEPNGSVVNFDIPYSKVVHLYGFFLPYKRCNVHSKLYLDKVVKMPKCYVAIFLDSGKYKLVPLPSEFYPFYRKYVGHELDRELAIYLGEHPELSLSFQTREQKLKYEKWLLDRYSITRKNQHYLLEN